MSKRCREEACPVCAHFHDYEGGVPCATCGHVYTKSEGATLRASKFPSEILPGRVWLGSFDNASRVELLKAMGITHILNCVCNCQPLYKNSFVYHTVSSSPPNFDECGEFLESVLSSKAENRVLIHCMTGASRSPSVAVAFLMRHRGWSLVDSFKWVKDRRPLTNLAKPDVERLQAAEFQLRRSSSVGWSPDGNAGWQAQGHGPFAWSWSDMPANPLPVSLPSVPLNLNAVPHPSRGANFTFNSQAPAVGQQAAMES